MRVSVHDRRAAGEGGAQSFHAASPRTGVVQHPDSRRLDLDDATLGQPGMERVVVHVADYGLDRDERLEVDQDACGDEVACVQDDVGFLEKARTGPRQAACAARQVRVGDDRDERQRRFLRFDFALGGGFGFGVATLNGRLANTFVRVGFISAWSSVASTK